MVQRGLGLFACNGVPVLRVCRFFRPHQHRVPPSSARRVRSQLALLWECDGANPGAPPYRTADTVRKLPGYGTVVAFSRALGARQMRVSALGYYSPPLSAVVIVLGMLVFFTGTCALLLRLEMDDAHAEPPRRPHQCLRSLRILTSGRTLPWVRALHWLLVLGGPPLLSCRSRCMFYSIKRPTQR